MKIIAMIPARYDSQRFPGKLTAKLMGKSLIVRTYENVRDMNLFDDVIVVTNSEIISNELQKNACKYIFNASQHASGTDRIAEAAEQTDFDIIVNVQGDEPFIGKKSLADLIDAFNAPEVKVATLAQRITNPEQINSPNIVKVIFDSANMSIYFSRCPIPHQRIHGRSAEYFQHIGVYAFRKQNLLDFVKIPQGKLEQTEMIECLRFLEHGTRLKVIITDGSGGGIDSPEDLIQAENYLQSKINNSYA